MTKHAIISTKIALPEDEFERAEHLLKVRAVKLAVQAVVAEHFPEATPEVAHEIVSPEPPNPPAAPKARKPRKVYETATPPVETVPEGTQDAPAPEAAPARHSRQKAA